MRLLPAPSIPTLLSPRVNPVQVRRLLRLGIILRWVAIVLTAPVGATELAPELRLSRREHDVVRLVAEGYSNTMIASRLNLSDNTVKSYVESLLTDLNARNRAEAVGAAPRLKLI